MITKDALPSSGGARDEAWARGIIPAVAGTQDQVAREYFWHQLALDP